MGDGNTHSEGGTAPPSRYAISSAVNVSLMGTMYGLPPFVTGNKMVFFSKSILSHRRASMLPAGAPVSNAVLHHMRLIVERPLTQRHHSRNSSGESAQLRAGIRATSTAVVGASGRLVSCFRAQRYTHDSSLTTWLLVAAPCFFVICRCSMRTPARSSPIACKLRPVQLFRYRSAL